MGEKHSLRVVEYSVLKKIFGRTWVDVTGDWRGLHTGEHHDLCFSHNFIRVIELRITRCAGHVTCMVHTGFWWARPEGNKPPGRPRRRWDDKIVLMK
jgi:hypothetical protein